MTGLLGAVYLMASVGPGLLGYDLKGVFLS